MPVAGAGLRRRTGSRCSGLPSGSVTRCALEALVASTGDVALRDSAVRYPVCRLPFR
jgi:hypothetical protein